MKDMLVSPEKKVATTVASPTFSISPSKVSGDVVIKEAAKGDDNGQQRSGVALRNNMPISKNKMIAKSGDKSAPSTSELNQAETI